jgi:hypothetical protein
VPCKQDSIVYYSQSPHGGDDRPGIGRRSGLGTHCLGCETRCDLEHVVWELNISTIRLLVDR